MAQVGRIFHYLMDDLMLLIMSVLIFGAVMCFRLRELIHFASLLRKIVVCSSEVFVKKRLLPILKNCVLQKVGAEQQWSIKNHDTVMTLLTESFLIAVGAYWLDIVQADISFSLWGIKSMPVGALKPGYLVLRAVILLLHKSMQIVIERFSRRGENNNNKKNGSNTVTHTHKLQPRTWDVNTTDNVYTKQMCNVI